MDKNKNKIVVICPDKEAREIECDAYLFVTLTQTKDGIQTNVSCPENKTARALMFYAATRALLDLD